MVQESKFETIYEDLRVRIQNGEFDQYQVLPTEKILQEYYQVSRNTVRKAIRQLNSEGMVYSKPGSSNIVLKRIDIEDILIDSGNIDRPSAIAKSAVTTKVLHFEKKTVTEDVAKLTTFKVGETYYHVIRLRIVNGTPAMIDDSFFLSEFLPNLTQDIAQESIYSYLQKTTNYKIVGSRLVDRISYANDFDKEHLELENFNAIGLTQNWSYLDNGDIFEYTEIHFAPNSYVRTRFIAQ